VIVIEASFYRSEDIVASFKNLSSKAPACPKKEEIRLTVMTEKVIHFLIRDCPPVPSGIGCDGFCRKVMRLCYFLDNFLKRRSHLDSLKGLFSHRIVSCSCPLCPMVNDSLNEVPLRFERVDNISDPDTKSLGTPPNVVNIEIGHGGADNSPAFVIDWIVYQT